MDADAQAALSAAYHLIRQTSNGARTNKANRQRAEDFIARASEFDARVHLSTAPKRIGADCVLLWFSTKPERRVTVISLSGAIDAEICALDAAIAAYNAHLAPPGLPK
jgi:hypothetical protein